MVSNVAFSLRAILGKVSMSNEKVPLKAGFAGSSDLPALP